MSEIEQTSSLFPLNHAVYTEAIQTFSRFDDDELQLLDAANLALLPEGSASRYVLEFNIRPQLRTGETELDELRRRAYRTGVLLGRRVVRQSIELEGDAEYIMMTQAHMDAVHRRVSRGKEFVPPQENNFSGFIDRRLAKIDPTYAFFPYLRIEDEVFQGVLRQAWLSAGLKYYTAESITHNIDNEIPRGMKDLFRVFALIDSTHNKNWHVKIAEDNEHTAAAAPENTEQPAQNATILDLYLVNQIIDKIEALPQLSLEMQQRLGQLYDERANLEKLDRLERRSMLLGKLTVPVAVGTPLVGAAMSGLVHAGPVAGLLLAGVTGASSFGVIRAIPYLENIARRTLRSVQ